MNFITYLPSSQKKTTVFAVVDWLSKMVHFCALRPQFTALFSARVFVQKSVAYMVSLLL
ncbi:hypothetical protein Syun_014120 [Stephania yunnanensis]|uniref:Uncharacterized protein n=1 Tax=Stephania yunnanensis TaxID=152371 RepID=A0AAP0JKU8_9MAGN